MYEIEIPDIKKLTAKLREFNTTSASELERAMQKSVLTLEGKARQNAPVFRGILRASLNSKVYDFGSTVIGRVGSSMKSEEYPAVMEYGRAPNSTPPPYKPLIPWVMRKWGLNEKEAVGAAIAKAKAIGKFGIPGRFYLKRAYEQSKGAIARFFDAALKNISGRIK